MTSLKINISNQIRQTKLPKNKPLLPLFEAVTNSLQAISERGGGHGSVEVILQREKLLPGVPDRRIQNVIIRDDGIGFTDENMDSFNTSFSDLKLRQGGKGIGRFSWLVVFERAEISSTFVDKSGLIRRSFTFHSNYDPDGVSAKPTTGRGPGTEVRLIGLSESYRKRAPSALDDIALALCEHFLLHFVQQTAVRITLRDEDDPASQIILGDYFASHFSDATQHEFEIDDRKFQLAGLRVKATPSARHRLIFCADGREVKKETLARALPNLPRPLVGSNDERFTYTGVIYGDYLDERVNSARTDFEIEDPGDDDGLFTGGNDISLDDIRAAAIDKVRSDLAPFLEEIRRAKDEAVVAYIQEEAPHYRVLMSERGAAVEQIRPNATKTEIELALHEVLYRKEVELKKLGARVILEADKIEDYETYANELQRFIEGENQVGLAALGKYVAHRKIMLTLLERALSKAPADKKYPLEEAVHNLVFPMRSTNEEILYSQQNLWLLDERLSYYSYISSDKPLSQSEVIESDSKKRPDIALFDRRFVFGEGQGPISSVVLIEFKRPMRDDYAREDPIDQVVEVIGQIRKGAFLDGNGRPVSIANKDVPCFAYLVCDLTQSLRAKLEKLDYYEHPDGQGFFDFHKGMRAYIEVISYNKLLSDAKKRNRVLFDRLNFPA